VRSTRGRQAKVVLFLLAVLIYAARVWWMDDGRYVLYDDALISFRYAHNLANGHGLVFNPGQRVEGYTNFLWVILLAGGMRLGVDVLWLAKAIGIVCGIGVLLLTLMVSDSLLPGAGNWIVFPSFLLASTASLPRYALSGMETLMFSVWLCLALWLELGVGGLKGGIFAAAALALASLTRPEGVLFFVVFAVARIVERALRGQRLFVLFREGLLRLLTFALIFAPYFAWRYGYYGYLLPNTFYAKAGGLSVAAVGRGLRYLRNELLILNLPMLLCGLFGLLLPKRRGVLAMLFTVVVYLAYVVTIGGDDFNVFGPRFLLVIFPWLAIVGLAGLIELAFQHLRAPQFFLMLSVVVLLVLECGLSAFEMIPYRDAIELNHGWWATAEWLAARAAPESLVAVDAAGIIPFHTGLPTIDMLGLNDVHIAHLSVATLGSGHAGHEKFDPDYVLTQKPIYITSWLAPGGRPLSAGLEQVAGRLREEYELVAVFLMRRPERGEPAWLNLDEMDYTDELFRRGYIYGIFRLQRGEEP